MLSGFERGERRIREGDRGEEVHLHHRPHSFDGLGRGLTNREDAGREDKMPKRARRLAARLNRALDRLMVPKIDDLEMRAELLGDGLELRLIAIPEHEPRAAVSKLPRKFGAEPARRACDQNGPMVDLHRHDFSLSLSAGIFRCELW